MLASTEKLSKANCIDMICIYCKNAPTIENSHVASKFLVRHIKNNSPTGFLINSWSNKKAQDGIKGPYLCATCDNEVFGGWENFFKRNVFDKLNFDASELSSEQSIRFVLSILFRYCAHFLATSPSSGNEDNNRKFLELSRDALSNVSQIGVSTYIYPWLFKPVDKSCKNNPGTNHFLSLALHADSLHGEDGLPDAFVIMLPSMLFLITDDDLSGYTGNELRQPEYLTLNASTDWLACNPDMPEFLSTLINRHVGQTHIHQRNMGLWGKISYGADKLLHPEKQAYKCQALDSALQKWQFKNCQKDQTKGV